MMNHIPRMTRRQFVAGAAAATAFGVAVRPAVSSKPTKKAMIAITLDLEMSRHYPRRGMMEWDYQKGNLDEPTKRYAVEAGRVVKARGGLIHFFCVGRVLEQPNIDWLKQLAAEGHSIGNHTYDHVNVKATTAEKTQFRFQRAPWLVQGRTAKQVIYENIRIANIGLTKRAGIEVNGFRTPGGFSNGLTDRPDIQQMLLELDFKWVSSKYPSHKRGKPKEEPTHDVYDSIVQAQKHAQPFVYPSGLIEIPMSPISDIGAFRSTYWKLDYFRKAIGLAVEWAIENGGVFDFLCHPSCMVVEDPKFETIKLICDLVEQAGDNAAIVDLGTIADRAKPS